MSFAGDGSKWTTKAKVETDAGFRKIVFEMAARVIERSPVDTGHFRNNWQITVGPTPTPTEREGNDVSGTAARARVLTELADVKAGQIAWISNPLVYGPRLEYGYSKQAPAGIVRLTAAEFGQIVAAA